ncbi:MAG TPA: peptide chain release factor N(5)-glutamine methyltransferase [Acidimicrobiales bacterium]|nr:peptide chain release factor N(5)-glutamine methyltransferase [Acidimicrobiales bacterium]
MAAVEAPGQSGPADRVAYRDALLASTADRLGSVREARWILEHMEAEGAEPGSAVERTEQLESLVARRVAGEPLQYVLGRWSFRALELTVDPRVLIPRPETEQVVEVALAELSRADAGSPVAVDLGTGSGAIALALATEGGRRFPRLEVWATDASADALAVAAQNLARLDSDDSSRVQLAEGGWFGALPDAVKGRVDLIVANPPYVSEAEYADLDPGVRDWEPREALVAPTGAGGVGGMADIETIVAGAPRWLRPGGALVVEIAPGQAYASIDAARRAGFRQVTTERDLAGRVRMLVARR